MVDQKEEKTKVGLENTTNYLACLFGNLSVHLVDNSQARMVMTINVYWAIMFT